MVGPGLTGGVVAAASRTGAVVFVLPLQPATPTTAAAVTTAIAVLMSTRIDVPFVGGPGDLTPRDAPRFPLGSGTCAAGS